MVIISTYMFILYNFLLEKVIKKRFKIIFPAIILVYMIIVMGANTYNPDLNSGIYDVYYRIYIQEELFTKDIGFGILMYFFKSIGCTYEIFRIIISIIGIYMIHLTVKKYIKNTHGLYLIYIVYPFFLDIVQIRNFLMMSVIIFAIPFMIEKSKKSTMKSLILCLLGASIQKLGLIYLPLCFLKYIHKKSLKYFVPIIFIVSLLIGLVTNRLMGFMGVIQSIIGDQLHGLSKYYSMMDNGNGYFVHWIIQILNFLSVLYANYLLDKIIIVKNENFISKKKVVNFALLVNSYLFMFLILYRIDITFTRIMRNVTIINLMAYFIVFESIKMVSKTKIVFLHNLLFRIVCICTIGIAFYRYLLFSNIDYIIKPILYNNFIIGIW